MTADPRFTIESSPFGRVVVAGGVPEGFALLYTTRDFGGRLDPATAAALTAYVRERFSVGGPLATCNQVHGANAERVAGGEAWRECGSCDALWSDAPNVVLGIKVADCLPVSMIDPVHGVSANVHSGWRGTAQRISEAALDTVQRETAFSPSGAFAWLGPAIRVCCFEVGEEVVEQLAASYDDVERFVDRSRARPHVDVAGLTAARLVRRGFAPERVIDSGLCTRCGDSLFHSYRRSPDGGRNLALLAQ